MARWLMINWKGSIHTSFAYMRICRQQVPSYQKIVGGSEDSEKEDGTMKMKRWRQLQLQRIGKREEGGVGRRKGRSGCV